MFLEQVDRFPSKTAVVCDGERFTYQELAERAATWAGVLSEMGVRPGSRIVLLLGNGVDFSAVILAAADLGAVTAPISTSLGRAAVVQAIRSTESTFLIGRGAILTDMLDRGALDFPIPPRNMVSADEAVPGCRIIPPPGSKSLPPYDWGRRGIPASADMVLTLTSGSTGAPKPIVLTQATKVERSLRGAKDLYELDELDVIVTSSPMFHSLGLRMALLPLLIGASSVILKHFTPAAWLDAVQANQVTFAILVSTQVELLLRRVKSHGGGGMKSLKTLVSSSATLKEDTKRACLDWFDCRFHECYGTSEVGIVTNLSPADGPCSLGSVGRALPYVGLKIVDQQGNPAPMGQPGEIACRTPTASSRYYGNAEATRTCVRGGYFHTGDIGYVDPRGYLHLCGRKSDLIIVGGANVYPEDVEEVIGACPGVRECAVIGVEDDDLGEAVVAVMVPGPGGADLRLIRTQCVAQLADYQQPMAYEFTDALPRTDLGKIQRRVLREQYRDYDAAAALRRLLRM